MHAAALETTDRATPDESSRGPADDHSFENQVLPLREELFACAMRYTRNPAAAEDLVQETLMRAYGAWHRFEPGSNPRAWAFRILTNSFINVYRKRRRRRQVSAEQFDDTARAAHGDTTVRSPNPQDLLLEHAVGDEVAAALATLGDDHRRIIEMADLQGLGYRDVARALGVPVGTVMSRLFRARRRLQPLLSEFAARDYGIGGAMASA